MPHDQSCVVGVDSVVFHAAALLRDGADRLAAGQSLVVAAGGVQLDVAVAPYGH